MLFFVHLAIRPRRGLCWLSVSLQPSGNNEGSSESLIQEWPSKKHHARAYVWYWIGPLKALTFSFAKPTTDFTFAATLGTIMHLLFFSLLLFELSLSFALSLSFSCICCIVLAEGQQPWRALNYSREACDWEVLEPLGGKKARCRVWYVTELSYSICLS